MVRAFIFILTILTGSHAFGQYQYDEVRQREADLYLKMIKKGQEYSNIKSPEFKMNERAVQEMADMWKRRAGKPTTPRVDDATFIKNWNLRQKEKAAQAAEMAHNAAERKKVVSLIDQKTELVYETFIEDGFPPFEARVMALNWVEEAKGEVKFVLHERSQLAAAAYKEYLQKEKTAGFDELLDLIVQFDMAGYSALKALEKLKVRFPEKKNFIDLIIPFYGTNFYVAHGFQNTDIKNNYEDPTSAFMIAGEDIKAEMNTYLTKWLKENPASAALLQRDYHSETSFKRLLKYQVVKQNKALLHDLLLGSVLFDTKNLSNAFYIRHATEDTPFRQLLSFDDFEIIRKHFNISGMEAIEKVINGKFMRVFHDAGKTATRWMSDLYTEELKGYGEEGDLNALNAYALLTYFEKTKNKKEEAYPMFKRVMDGGLPYPIFIMNDPKALKIAGIENFDIYRRELEFKCEFTKEEQEVLKDIPRNLMPRFLLEISFPRDNRLKIAQPGGPQKTLYYYGDIKNGMANGFGRSVTPEGIQYKGYWKNNKFHGEGELNQTEIGAEPFKGIFLDGKMYGYYAIDKKRKGHFNADKFVRDNNYKELEFSVPEIEGVATYRGEVANGMANGFGRAEFTNKTTYEGFWKNNKFEGTGILEVANDPPYLGEFRDGKFNGWGRKNFGYARMYVGDWKDGDVTGNGSFSWEHPIEGAFINGIPYFPNTPQRKNVTPSTASFNNWQEAVENFDWLWLQTPIYDKAILRYFKEGRLHFNTLTERNVVTLTYLTGREIGDYAYEATYLLLNKKEAKGQNGLIILNKNNTGGITRLFFLIKPSSGKFYVGFLDAARDEWVDFTSPGENNGWLRSAAIKGYDRNGVATNMLSIRKKGTVISFYVNDQLLFTQKTSDAGRGFLERFAGIGLVQANFAEGSVSDIRFVEDGPGKK